MPSLPFVMGHEPSGVVAAVGERVTRFAAGDRVLPNIFFSCGSCFFCRTNGETQCIDLGGILGVAEHWGGYGRLFCVPERQLFHLPQAISFAEGAVIADAVVTAVHAVERGGVQAGETVLVMGAGGCGSAVLQVCMMAGARAVGVDVTRAKQMRALELGATEALVAGEVDVPGAARDLTHGLGADCVIDTVGSERTLAESVASLRRGGRLVILGYSQDRYALDPRQIAINELEVLGTRSGGRQNTADAIRVVADPCWKPIVTDILPIEQVNEALKRMRTGQALGRIVLVHND